MTPSIIKHDRVRIDAGAPVAAFEPAPEPCAGRSVPKGVRLLERDGRVHAIELTCACGDVSVVELDYGAPRTQPGTKQSPERAEETR